VSAAAARNMISAQGVKMGRPSRIHIDIASGDDGAVQQVRVGGQAVQVAEGTLTL
jgi:predicted PhzF superfamily epimerase YddE/YHI9